MQQLKRDIHTAVERTGNVPSVPIAIGIAPSNLGTNDTPDKAALLLLTLVARGRTRLFLSGYLLDDAVCVLRSGNVECVGLTTAIIRDLLTQDEMVPRLKETSQHTKPGGILIEQGGRVVEEKLGHILETTSWEGASKAAVVINVV